MQVKKRMKRHGKIHSPDEGRGGAGCCRRSQTERTMRHQDFNIVLGPMTWKAESQGAINLHQGETKRRHHSQLLSDFFLVLPPKPLKCNQARYSYHSYLPFTFTSTEASLIHSFTHSFIHSLIHSQPKRGNQLKEIDANFLFFHFFSFVAEGLEKMVRK